MKIGVLVSGGGTNLQAIIDQIQSGAIHQTEIAFVFSNNRKAYALERARRAGIEAVACSPKEFPTREAFHQEVLRILTSYDVDLLVLAGCLMYIPPEIIERFHHRMINIHPSLIPSFCGKGYYGLKVHEKVLERGVKVTGATVHFVDSGLDSGPILLQKAVAVEDDDTPEMLQKRVMEQAEWVILPQAIDYLARGMVTIEGRKTRIQED